MSCEMRNVLCEHDKVFKRLMFSPEKNQIFSKSAVDWFLHDKNTDTKWVNRISKVVVA